MRVPLSWLKEYVDITLSVEELAERLTLAGLEVTSVEKIGDWWDREHILVGQIVEVRPHPNADRLTLPVVDYGGPRPMQMVTGAPNITVGSSGQKVVVALAGAELIDGYSDEERHFILKPTTIRGVRSGAMVCSEKELGLSDDHTGILVLPEDAPVGVPLADYLGDVVFDIDLTPNLARCLSIVGVAREVAALTGQTLRKPEMDMLAEGPAAEEQVEVVIDEPDLCARYCAVVIRGVKVGPSPYWVQRRLMLSGIRPLNNIVDITNYVMLELGQPLHAFDYERLHGPSGNLPPVERPIIRVRRAHKGEHFVTLDGQDRELDEDILLITDGAGPVAVAGVMGGLDSEIREDTRVVLLEAASFDMIGNRVASQRLRLLSEASHRFGRGVPPSLSEPAARRAAEMIRTIAGGQIQDGVVQAYPRPQRQIAVPLNVDRARAVLGLPVTDEEIERILTALEFEVSREDTRWMVTVPQSRLDVEIEEDLYEEIARVYGYDRFPQTLMHSELPSLHDDRAIRAEEFLRDVLVACGIQEAITYSLTDWRLEALLDDRLTESDYLKTVNPLSSDRQWLRRSVLPGLLIAARDNFRHTDQVALFEIGNCFVPVDGRELPDEVLKLGFVIGGLREGRSWLLAEPDARDFFDGKGVLDEIGERFRVPLEIKATSMAGLHPGRAAAVSLKGGSQIGYIGELHPLVREQFDLPEFRICVCELKVAPLFEAWVERPHLEPVSRYPAVIQDMALIVPEEVSASMVEEYIRQTGRGLVTSVTLFDVYTGDPIPAGYRNLAFRLSYQAPDRTLTAEEVRRLHNRIGRRLERELGAQLRE